MEGAPIGKMRKNYPQDILFKFSAVAILKFLGKHSVVKDSRMYRHFAGPPAANPLIRYWHTIRLPRVVSVAARGLSLPVPQATVCRLLLWVSRRGSSCCRQIWRVPSRHLHSIRRMMANRSKDSPQPGLRADSAELEPPIPIRRSWLWQSWQCISD